MSTKSLTVVKQLIPTTTWRMREKIGSWSFTNRHLQHYESKPRLAILGRLHLPELTDVDDVGSCCCS